MPTNTIAYLRGGPCDNTSRLLDYLGPPPETLRCRGVDYHYMPNARGTLTYGTDEFIRHYNATAATRISRDVLQAWGRLTRAWSRRVPGELHRIDRARIRLRRAVR